MDKPVTRSARKPGSLRVGWLVLGLFALPLAASAGAPEYDDCDAGFIAFLGAEAYQFSPALVGDLGSVRLYSVLSYRRAAALEELGSVFWRLEIRDEPGRLVRAAQGAARIDASGRAIGEFVWDGRDEQGRWVPPGRYRYTFLGRFAPDRLRPDRPLAEYKDLHDLPGVTEAFASTEEVIVDYSLTADASFRLRQSAAQGACQPQRNVPIESGFGYNFYYGSTHSHSNGSDGGHPTDRCSPSRYGSGTFDPAAVFDFARHSAGLDYWVVNEHNHLIDDAVANNNPPVTEAKVRQRYAAGRAAADAATVDDVFVALYGMEWGVTTNSDQGHVTLLETPVLFGWETCSNCDGPTPQCTRGANCYFDVFTPKRHGYLALYRRSLENPSPAGALGILCHPEAHHFDDFAFNDDADQALQGIAVRSGEAFNTAVDCSDANVASANYWPRWKEALNRGFHLGPVADHDAHCNNYGTGIPNRTVYLLPNAAVPVLTKAALLKAHKARHFFASEDSNAQLVFAAADGAHVMGDIFNAGGPVSLRAALYDPDNEAVSRIEIWRGQIGGGVPGSPYETALNQSTLRITENLPGGTYYYYVHAVQADGHDLWSAPMWITYSSAPCSSCGIDISGWKVRQADSAYEYTLPAGTRIPDNGYLVLGRDASQSAFETFWRRGSLPANAVYINSGGAMPLINGAESYELLDASGARVDGPTIKMPRSAGSTVQRRDPCLVSSRKKSWTINKSSKATPGSNAGPGCRKGVVINEFSDAEGTGNFPYEFVELHYDR
ncbi:MAG TPA: hypothetical protein VGG03_09625 [Thermoanaerobaculia bacterium]|jgi:hypothetical protein